MLLAMLMCIASMVDTEELDPEAKRVLYDNLWDLYE